MDIAYWKERIEIVTLAMKDSIKMNKQQLLALFQEMIQEEDMENANKIVDLYKKNMKIKNLLSVLQVIFLQGNHL